MDAQYLTNPRSRCVVSSKERGTPAFGVSGEAHVVPFALHAGDDGAGARSMSRATSGAPAAVRLSARRGADGRGNQSSIGLTIRAPHVHVIETTVSSTPLSSIVFARHQDRG
jgi:hypothetical protein